MTLCRNADTEESVQTKSGEWYLAHLCARPKNGDDPRVLGRETAIQKLVLDADGWFRLKCGGRYAGNETESPEEIMRGEAEQKRRLWMNLQRKTDGTGGRTVIVPREDHLEAMQA